MPWHCSQQSKYHTNADFEEAECRVTAEIQWCYDEHDGFSNHRCLDCVLIRLFRCRSTKTSKLRITGLCEGNSPVAFGFLSQRASNVENVSIRLRHVNRCYFSKWLIGSIHGTTWYLKGGKISSNGWLDLSQNNQFWRTSGELGPVIHHKNDSKARSAKDKWGVVLQLYTRHVVRFSVIFC